MPPSLSRCTVPPAPFPSRCTMHTHFSPSHVSTCNPVLGGHDRVSNTCILTRSFLFWSPFLSPIDARTLLLQMRCKTANPPCFYEARKVEVKMMREWCQEAYDAHP